MHSTVVKSFSMNDKTQGAFSPGSNSSSGRGRVYYLASEAPSKVEVSWDPEQFFYGIAFQQNLNIQLVSHSLATNKQLSFSRKI